MIKEYWMIIEKSLSEKDELFGNKKVAVKISLFIYQTSYCPKFNSNKPIRTLQL